MRLRVLVLLLAPFVVVGLLTSCKGDSNSTDPPVELRFKGTISSGSQRLADVSVYLSWEDSMRTQTNANGEFQFSGFSGSHFIITPSLEGQAFSPSNYELAGQPRNDLDFIAQPASYGSVSREIAANFSAKNWDGKNVSLYDYFGQVVLIDFSADWCGPCKEEAGHLEKIYQDYKDSGFQIITLLISGYPGIWAGDYKLTFPVVSDTSEKVFGIYEEGYVPLNIVLDRNMTIRYKQSGYYESAIINTIKKYL